MRITRIETRTISMRLAEAYVIAYEAVESARNVLVRVETDDGVVGFGCAAPDQPVTGETAETVEAAISNVVEPVLRGCDPVRWSAALEEAKRVVVCVAGGAGGGGHGAVRHCREGGGAAGVEAAGRLPRIHRDERDDRNSARGRDGGCGETLAREGFPLFEDQGWARCRGRYCADSEGSGSRRAGNRAAV